MINTELSDFLAKIDSSIKGTNDIKEILVNLLLITNDSYYTAYVKSGDILGDNGKLRVTYYPNSAQLSKFNLDQRVNYETEEQSLEFISTCIKDYLSSKTDLSMCSVSERNASVLKVKALLIQLISSGLIFKLNDLPIPNYAQEGLDKSLKFIEDQSQKVFDDFIEDAKEYEPENVIDHIKFLGYDVFGAHVTTKGVDHFYSIMGPVFKDIQHYNELYNKWKFRRNEYRSKVINIDKKWLYQFFEMAERTYTTKKSELANEFILRYNADNTKLIYKLIYGIE